MENRKKEKDICLQGVWLHKGDEMKWIFTNNDRYFKDEFQEAWLSEETGWWTPSGDIYIWTSRQEWLKQIGVAVHESFEWFILCQVIYGLRKKHRLLFKFLSDGVHNIANVLEFIVSCGRADQYWGKQDWYGGKNQGWGSKNPKQRRTGS